MRGEECVACGDRGNASGPTRYRRSYRADQISGQSIADEPPPLGRAIGRSLSAGSAAGGHCASTDGAEDSISGFAPDRGQVGAPSGQPRKDPTAVPRPTEAASTSETTTATRRAQVRHPEPGRSSPSQGHDCVHFRFIRSRQEYASARAKPGRTAAFASGPAQRGESSRDPARAPNRSSGLRRASRRPQRADLVTGQRQRALDRPGSRTPGTRTSSSPPPRRRRPGPCHSRVRQRSETHVPRRFRFFCDFMCVSFCGGCRPCAR